MVKPLKLKTTDRCDKGVSKYAMCIPNRGVSLSANKLIFMDDTNLHPMRRF